jgi:hypothetical protein
MSLQTQENEASIFYREFLKSCDGMGNLASRLGIQVQPVMNESAPHFLKLPLSDQAAVLERLKIYSSLLELSANEELLDEKRLLWFALSRLRLRPPSNLLDLVGENDLVEVYVGARQVYRSFNYYNYCSYSLDELETVPWNLLFARDEHYTEQIFAEVKEALDSRKILTSRVPSHEVREIASAFQNKFLYQLKYLIPLKDMENDSQDCMVCILKAEVLESPQQAERSAKLEAYLNRRLKEIAGEI